MAQSYVISLYLSFPPNFVTGNVRLACPNATAVDAANDAIRRGWIWWHALPANAHTELSQDGSLLRAAVELTHNLDDEFGLPRKSVLSQRDVPGLSVAPFPSEPTATSRTRSRTRDDCVHARALCVLRHAWRLCSSRLPAHFGGRTKPQTGRGPSCSGCPMPAITEASAMRTA